MSITTLADRTRRSHSILYRLPRFTPLTIAAMIGSVLIVLASAFTDIITHHDPLAIYTDAPFHPPNSDFWFGTDNFGRDIFARTLFGMRSSLVIAITAVVLGASVGGFIGLLSGYLGGAVDFVLQRFVEIVSALPTLVSAIVVAAVLGPSKWNVALAIGVVIVPSNARVMRAAAMKVSTSMFCEAARALGASRTRVMLRHIFPNCVGPLLVVSTANFGQAILAEASLGFLGLGVPPPEPTLGGMLSGAVQQYFYQAPWMAVFPGLVISLLVFCANLLGDAVRDYLDPRLRSHL